MWKFFYPCRVKYLSVLWRFSRPHTVIGSTLSITALYALAMRDGHPLDRQLFTLLLPSLGSALACNVYITGLNQWADVEVDRINKPHLPLPAGDLTRSQALRIVLVSLVLALGLAAVFSAAFLMLIALIAGIGTAYSLPPLKFKRHHLLAAGAIALVRGLLVNLGFYLHFRREVFGTAGLDLPVWPLTAFVAAFSLGIAWFKDIPDTAGDAVHRFGTLAVRMGRLTALRLGVVAVSAAYLYVATAAWAGMLPNRAYFIAIHVGALILFWIQAARLQVSDNTGVKRFYYFFWGLFFLEYLLYPLGFYL